MGIRHLALTLALILATVWIPGAAFSQTTQEKAARILFQEAIELYAEGDYNQTLNKLNAAYELFPSPAFLFNLGLTWEKKGDSSRAAAFFRRYLTESGTKDESLSRRIELLEATAKTSGLTPREAEKPVIMESGTVFDSAIANSTVVAVPAVKKKYGAWPWVTLSTTGASLATGIIFAALSRQNYNAAVHLSDQTTHTPADERRLADLKDTTRTQSIVADTFFGVAIASGIVTLALFLTESYAKKKPEKKTVEVAPVLGPDGMTGVAFTGRF